MSRWLQQSEIADFSLERGRAFGKKDSFVYSCPACNTQEVRMSLEAVFRKSMVPPSVVGTDKPLHVKVEVHFPNHEPLDYYFGLVEIGTETFFFGAHRPSGRQKELFLHPGTVEDLQRFAQDSEINAQLSAKATVTCPRTRNEILTIVAKLWEIAGTTVAEEMPYVP